MRGGITFNSKRLGKAVEKHGENVVKKFAASTFKTIIKISPRKNTLSASGKYRRTGGFVEGWNIKQTGNGYKIFNETNYAPYYEYGHRTRNGGVVKGAYTMSRSIDENLKKYGLTATRRGGV